MLSLPAGTIGPFSPGVASRLAVSFSTDLMFRVLRCMQVHITAVGPDNCGLADPIVHYVTGQGGQYR